MKKIGFIVFLTVIAMMGAWGQSNSTRADVVVWQDPDFNYSLSYPDRWSSFFHRETPTRHAMHTRHSDEGSCVVLAEKDGRYLIYNADELPTMVLRDINETFWQKYLPFMNVYDRRPLQFEIKTIRNGSLAQGFARFVTAQYQTDKGDTIKGIYFATLYSDMIFVIGCQSKAAAFGKILPTFMGVIDSVRFENKYRPFPSNYYRDFLADDIFE